MAKDKQKSVRNAKRYRMTRSFILNGGYTYNLPYTWDGIHEIFREDFDAVRQHYGVTTELREPMDGRDCLGGELLQQGTPEVALLQSRKRAVLLAIFQTLVAAGLSKTDAGIFVGYNPPTVRRWEAAFGQLIEVDDG